jgi:hypothetical protein
MGGLRRQLQKGLSADVPYAQIFGFPTAIAAEHEAKFIISRSDKSRKLRGARSR